MENKRMGKKIVLIDDDLLILDMYNRKLKEENFEVYIAQNGKAGFKLVLEKKPDLVVSDVVMPKEDGFYLVEKVKNNKITKNIPIIAFTNLNNETDKEHILKLGASEYLVKSSISPSQLVIEINKFLTNASLK